MKNFGKSSRGHSQGVQKIFMAPIYGAHCAVIFATAQLSCYINCLEQRCSYMVDWTVDSSSVICLWSRFMSVSSYCSPNAAFFKSSFLISRLLTVSFYLLFFYPTSFLPIHHAAIHHAVTHNPSIYVYGTIMCSIFFCLLEPYYITDDIYY